MASKLKEWGGTFEEGIAVTGIVATIEGRTNASGQAVALRADIDALDGKVPDGVQIDALMRIWHLLRSMTRWLLNLPGEKLAIARAVVNRPAILLADEPTGALDRANTEKIVQLFQQLNEKGKTIIIVTHDDFVAQSCRRIVTIADGVIKST